MGSTRINIAIAETISELKVKYKPDWYRKQELGKIKNNLEQIKIKYNATIKVCSKV